MYSVSYSKPNKRFVAKPVKIEKNFDYLHYITRKIFKRSEQNKKVSKQNRLKRQCSLKITPRERPPNDEVIEQSNKYKRIKL